MSHNTVVNRCSMFAVALTAMAGVLILPAPAKADPACDWQFKGSLELTQSDGYVVSIPAKDTKNLLGGQRQASMFGTGLKEFEGNPNGKIVGDHLQLTVQWEGVGFRAFPGEIHPDGSVTGIVQQVDKDVATYTSIPLTLKCVTAPAPAAAATSATVVKDTDIYDKPDGLGQRIGSLYVGEVHPLMEPCRDDWCRVGTIELGGFPGLQNGTAWVYSKGYLTFSQSRPFLHTELGAQYPSRLRLVADARRSGAIKHRAVRVEWLAARKPSDRM